MTEVYVSDDVRQVEELHRELLTPAMLAQPIAARLDLQARNLLAAHRAGDPAAAVEIRACCPRLSGRSAGEILAAPFELEDARLTVAREHGYHDWAQVVAQGDRVANPLFEATIDAVVNGDIERLEDLLAREPTAVNERSAFAHRSTPLVYLMANGVEIRRQKTPRNAPDVARRLLESGADVHARAFAWGSAPTALELLMSSELSDEAGVRDELAAVLRAAGARED
jgi:hypothetical protein